MNTETKTNELVVAIPLLLKGAVDGAREVTVNGDTLQSAIDDLLSRYPLLRPHLYENERQLRKHVLMLYNNQNTRWFSSLEIATKPGDRITILQAVSGG